MSKTKQSAHNITEAKKELLEWLKPSDTVYTVCRHVSQSGMSRRISCFIADEEKRIYCIDWRIAQLGLFKLHPKKQGLVVSGCGMDMGFHVVYSLGRSLFKDGFKLAKDQYGRNGDKSGFDNDGGYALTKRWL